MELKEYLIPKKKDSSGFIFQKIGPWQGKVRAGQVGQYKQIDGFLHVIEYPNYYAIHVDTYSSICGPVGYIKHGMLELFPNFIRGQTKKIKKWLDKN